MKKIQRFTPSIVCGQLGFSRAVMTHCDDGGYVDIQSHWEEVRRLKGEIDALKSMQKSKIIEGLHPLAYKGVEALLESVIESIKGSDEFKKLVEQSKYALDPELTRNIAEGWRSCFATGGYVGALLNNETVTCRDESGTVRMTIGKTFLNNAVIKSGSIRDSEISDRIKETIRRGPVSEGPLIPEGKALCVYSTSHVFTRGKVYDLEAAGDMAIRIASDNLVSDLNEEDHWVGHSIKGGTLYKVGIGNGLAAEFKINK